ncbi:hypothetical protein DERP_003295 [Dermatophagoides pteronyssinus]|uniref:Uncharacterized protein n=1 Tax=Dermatophagoides pteronyssinus TaxID=6956 RepID=A0ABQ8JJ56_DERPT|nr:hypothetical protein DERP_003295 [Dermatophagoides pteronyssinus]
MNEFSDKKNSTSVDIINIQQTKLQNSNLLVYELCKITFFLKNGENILAVLFSTHSNIISPTGIS